ncbi:MAG TPA: sigma-70 family RNA polymerase sigma factor [Flavisolibacter sp.]|nr:sigma-70 family RNA polymerase sigma factor [Flavisolibacter sp.]
MAFLTNISSGGHSDEELVNRYKKTKDMKLVGELYQRYMDLIYGVCLKYLKQPENAQDSVILIFEELTTKLLKHEVENFRGWLYTLAKNHCLMRLRSEKKAVTVNFDVELVQSEENVHLNGELDKEENFRKLDYCLGQLQAEQKTVVELFYLQEKCYNEIAALTGMEWNRVRSHIQNGRRNLKICMESQKAKSIVENDAVIKK